jgi:hypothetical protein
VRFLVATIAVAAVSGCGGSRPAVRYFVSPVLLKRGMTFARNTVAGEDHRTR